MKTNDTLAWRTRGSVSHARATPIMQPRTLHVVSAEGLPKWPAFGAGQAQVLAPTRGIGGAFVFRKER